MVVLIGLYSMMTGGGHATGVSEISYSQLLNRVNAGDVKSVVIRGEPFASYMGIEGLEAEHRTLVLGGATPRQEVQLLRLLQPPALLNPGLATLRQRGFNHVCLATDDLDGEVARLRAAGVTPRNAVMAFHDRKLVFLDGPEGAVVELAEWH